MKYSRENIKIIELREKRDKRKIAKGKLKAIAVVSAIALIVVAFLLSPFFNIKVIEVNDNKVCSKTDIINNCGIIYGQNIFKTNTKQARSNIIKNFPYIEDVDISNKLPDRIIINITEREAIGAVPYMGSHILVDKNGNALQVVSSEEMPEDITIIKGVSFERFELGHVLPVDDHEKLNVTVKIVQLLIRHNLLDKVNTIDVYDIRNIHLTVHSDLVINIAGNDDLDYKINYVGEILKRLGNDKKGYIDFSTGNNPILKPGN